MSPTYTITWRRISLSPSLPRSSHCLSLIAGRAIIYGGELRPREPIDSTAELAGAVHTVSLNASAEDPQSSPSSKPCPLSAHGSEEVPLPRVGAASASIGNALYMWGGRGGVDMEPLNTYQVGLWKAELGENGVKWERIKAENEANSPESKSYHVMVSAENKLFIHAGCPASGRSSELHAFDIRTRTWQALAPAPEPGRGGTALAVSTLTGQTVLLRFGGFAGHELGADHALDVYTPATDIWSSSTPAPDPLHGYPGARSVHGFVGLTVDVPPSLSEIPIALLYHGERDASALGHAGAGTFWDDVWVLVQRIAGGELAWRKAGDVEGGRRPEARGWFPAAADGTGRGALLMGGLLGSNERAGDLWVATLTVVEDK